MRTNIEVYTDGACRGNGADGAVGGWAYVIYSKVGQSINKTRNYGAEKGTTNNKMELTAILMALRDLEKYGDLGEPIIIYSDSAYSIGCVTQWIEAWKRRGWKKSDGSPILNLDIIKQIDDLIGRCANIKFIKVKGHSGDSRNDEADFYCNQAMDELLKAESKEF